MSSKSLALLLVSTLALSACGAVGPNPFAKRDAKLPASFVESEAGEVLASRAFWTEYQDKTLTGLVTRALAQSLDLKAAEQRIRAAEADLRAAAPLSSLLSGSTTVQRDRAGSEAVAGVSQTTTSVLSAGFVLDLFGRAQRARDAAASGVEAATAGAETARLAMLAELIAAYSDARYYQQALSLTRETISIRAHTVEITKTKLYVGTATQFDLAQAEAQLATARAELPGLEAQFNAQVFRLARLMDEPAAPLLAEMQKGAAPLRTPPGPGTGTPADLLRNRPDIRASEAALVAATAAVGMAEADLLPSLTLAGKVTDIGGATAWSFGPQLALPLLTHSRLAAAKDRKLAEAAQAEIAWRAAVAKAVEDVQRAQSNLRRARQRVVMLEAAAKAQDEAYRLATANFEAGSLTLLNLLEVDRARAASKLAVATARNEAAKGWAVLQIALGAGAKP